MAYLRFLQSCLAKDPRVLVFLTVVVVLAIGSMLVVVVVVVVVIVCVVFKTFLNPSEGTTDLTYAIVVRHGFVLMQSAVATLVVEAVVVVVSTVVIDLSLVSTTFVVVVVVTVVLTTARLWDVIGDKCSLTTRNTLDVPVLKLVANRW